MRSSTTDTTAGVVVAIPSRRPAVSADTTTESAPDWRSRCTFSASRTAAVIVIFGAISRAVRVTITAVSSRLVATTSAVACGRPDVRSTDDWVASPAHRHQPERGRRVEPSAVGVDDDDVVDVVPVAAQRGDRGLALRPVAHDHDVVAHAGPPAVGCGTPDGTAR